jgi:hypothetical protein
VLCSELIFCRRWQLREARRHPNGTAETAGSFRLLSSNAYDNPLHSPANLSLLNGHAPWLPTPSPRSPPLPSGRLLQLQAPILVLLPSFPFSGPMITLLLLSPHAQPSPVRDINPQMRSVGSRLTRAGLPSPSPQPQCWNAVPLFQSQGNPSLCNYTPKSVPLLR